MVIWGGKQDHVTNIWVPQSYKHPVLRPRLDQWASVTRDLVEAHRQLVSTPDYVPYRETVDVSTPSAVATAALNMSTDEQMKLLQQLQSQLAQKSATGTQQPQPSGSSSASATPAIHPV